MLMIQANNYESDATQHAMSDEMRRLIASLIRLSAEGAKMTTMVPVDLIAYVEGARNPTVYTRQFVELAMELNQKSLGQSQAFSRFSDLLSEEISSAIPELRDSA